ncbi:MAG: aminotransferase class V-fold PLP-dependent enzyme [Bryobacterales bacterium]|nr:aminotransferase class V-fold PLP-dependent enzyme [Bryobacterales bacterium]
MFRRRSFIDLIARIPGLGLLAAAAGAAPQAKPVSRDYFRELGVKPFINAAGTYTALTASLMPPEVRDAWQYATGHYVKLTDLQDAVGARIAELTGAEAAMVTSGAAGALTVGTAGVLTGADPEKIRRLPDTSGMRDEVLIQKSHRFAYDHAVRSAGVTMVEVETREDVERLAGGRTAMMLFFNDANHRGAIDGEEWVRIARQHGVPTFIDCAADVPPATNLTKYLKMGFDLVTFSGGKGLMGPQSAGLLLGRKDLIQAARLNTSPFSDTLARGMKVNKEEMLAMMVAVERYLKRDHAADLREWNRRCEVIAKAAQQVKTVTSDVFVPPVANHVPHLELRWDASTVKLTPHEAMRRLAEGNPSIEACPLTDKERLVFGVWMMQPGDAERVARRVAEVLRAAV